MQTSMTLDGFAISTVRINNCRTNFWFRSQDDAVDRIRNADLREKSGQEWLWKNLLFIIAMQNNALKIVSKGNDTMKKTE